MLNILSACRLVKSCFELVDLRVYNNIGMLFIFSPNLGKLNKVIKPIM